MPLTTQLQQSLLSHSYALANQQQAYLPALVLGTGIALDNTPLQTTRSTVRALALHLRNATELQCSTLVDIAVTDKLLDRGRFVVNYHFLSTVLNHRMRVQLFVGETTTIPSLAAPFVNQQKLFAGAG